jgi:D-alanyl-lipoteichoic acid acyltransferase DltB (MBOAT superfamily)
MLFNSLEFVVLFLPITVALFFCAPTSRQAQLALVAASIFFYGWWNEIFLLLILGGVAINFFLSRYLLRSALQARRRAVLVGGIVVNLLPLLYFKYSFFVVENIAAATGLAVAIEKAILPLAISFYTFQKITLLVDSYHRRVPDVDFLSYCLFIIFFPHLIAGPITSPREMLPQFQDRGTYRFRIEDFSLGTTIFVAGLFKKVVIADTIADYSTPMFAAADQGATLTFVQSWCGALAFTFQLYFDFSGYSDMAVGLARMFNVRMPINFYSPYKSTSIIEFWRRWHMSLSWFLREYIYIPLGGNRRGLRLQLAALFVTMLAAGIWHGAGWTFVIFGVLHGSFLVLNTLWRRLPLRPFLPPAAAALAGWTLTFVAVVVGWVFFRAETVGGALGVIEGMLGLNGIVLPATYADTFGFLTALGVRFDEGAAYAGRIQLAITGALLILVLVAPNTTQIFEPSRQVDARVAARPYIVASWQPSLRWALLMAGATFISLASIQGYSEFLYFNF